MPTSLIIDPTKLGPAAPLYSSLSNVELILDATGLRPNTNNSYGIVDSASNVTTWKSLAPGPTGRDFVAADIITSGNALKLLDGCLQFAGEGRVTHATASTWNFMHYNATPANLKWTVHMVLKVGNRTNPGGFYGIMGNNGASNANKGIALGFNDAASAADNQIYASITRGSAPAILNGAANGGITPNTWFVYTVETDLSLTAADRQKYYINGVRYAHTVTSTSTAVVTTPTSNMSIGNITGLSNGFNGCISHVVIQSTVESAGTMGAFVTSLLPYTRLKGDQYWQVDEAQRFTQISLIDETTKYYLSTCLDQKPTALDTIIKCFRHDDAHVSTAAGKIVKYKSTDRGWTWGTVADVLNPSGNNTVADLSGGYSNNGTHHIICDVHDSTNMDSWTVHHLTTTDDYDTAPTDTDITAAIASDGQTGLRCYGNIIENNGVLMSPYYKTATEASSATSSRFVLRSTDGGANWTSITVETGSTFINEGSIIALDNSNVMLICRNESTKEFTMYLSSDNGATWSNSGDVSFGLTLSVAGPPRLTAFTHTNESTKVQTRVIALWFADKGNEDSRVVFGKASSLVSGTSGWVTASLLTILTTTQQANRIFHYGDYFHPYGTYECIGASAREPNTPTLTENTHITYALPSDRYFSTMVALGI